MVAVRQNVTIGPGGRIEVQSPRLTEGAQAEVIVLVEEATNTGLSPLEAFHKLQESLKLTPEAAAEWLRVARTEREGFGKNS